MGVQAEVMFLEREGGSANGREMPAINRDWSCVYRGPGGGRRAFVVFEAAPRGLSSGEDSGGKRTKTGEKALREPFGRMRVVAPAPSSASARAA